MVKGTAILIYMKCCSNKKGGWPYWIWKLYLEWLEENKIQEKDHPVEEFYWRFKTGDCVPKQGYSNFQEYIKDCACQVPKNRDLSDSINSIREETIRTRTQFGVRWSI